MFPEIRVGIFEPSRPASKPFFFVVFCNPSTVRRYNCGQVSPRAQTKHSHLGRVVWFLVFSVRANLSLRFSRLPLLRSAACAPRSRHPPRSFLIAFIVNLEVARFLLRRVCISTLFWVTQNHKINLSRTLYFECPLGSETSPSPFRYVHLCVSPYSPNHSPSRIPTLGKYNFSTVIYTSAVHASYALLFEKLPGNEMEMIPVSAQISGRLVFVGSGQIIIWLTREDGPTFNYQRGSTMASYGTHVFSNDYNFSNAGNWGHILVLRTFFFILINTFFIRTILFSNAAVC